MSRNKKDSGLKIPDVPDFTIERLGSPKYDSPLKDYLETQINTHGFTSDNERIVYDPRAESIKKYQSQGIEIPSMEIAGPRGKIYFNSSMFRGAIVTCGGLCPGLNDVIRAIFMELYYRYRVKEVFGIRYGFSGLVPRIGRPPITIKPIMVENIHREGGTLLGSSRGYQDPKEIVDFLERERINVLFTIGGDGTQRGALSIAEEIERRKLKIGIIGIPKTIDNDISYVERSFGFRTAVSISRDVLSTGHEEARGAYNGVAIVKLMGRNSGFIAAMASIANGDVNFVLVPEVPFDMDGDRGFLKVLERRLEERQHALVVVAEGAGQELFEDKNTEKSLDASGNSKLGNIGIYIRDRVTSYFSAGWKTATVKYIDPSYIIRSSPANASDSIFCIQLAQNAVHAAMSGRTKMIVSLWNNTFTYVPMSAVISARKKLDPAGPEWLAVLEATGQPVLMKN
ncbi:ATP-dependent 6-phosphofructokinase [Candidatus Latescibacterota bacterium]